MEWYKIAAIIAGFFGVIGVLAYLGAKGILTKKVVSTLSGILQPVDIGVEGVAEATESPVIDVMAMLVSLVNRAVLAAENAFYNGKITADQRHDVCMAQLDNFLEAAEINITVAQRQAVDGLVAAACEEIGHGMVAAKEEEAKHAGFEPKYEEG